MVGHDTAVGQTLGHYRIVEKIGAGGMGEVYRARDEHLARDVAIKVLPPGTLVDESARKRFRKEATALSKISHPNVATIFDFDTQDETAYLAMEYIPGVSLADKLAGGRLPESEVVRLGTQSAEGLAAAHEQGVLHRDLKPGNMRITVDGRVKILDFGLAKLRRAGADAELTESLTETHAITGTLPYMPPEQLRGEPVDERSDIYSLGVVLFEMATSRLPFQEKLSTALADSILHKPCPPPGRLNPELTPRLEEIILKCLEKDRDNRYRSAKDLVVDLRRLSAPVEARSRRRLRWRLPAVVSTVVLVIIVAGILAVNLGGIRQRLLGRAPAPRIESLAVLPLANLSGDPQQEYFADGMTEALITDLSKIAALRVISRTSVLPYRGAKRPLPEIARELNVDAVVEGSVLRAGGRVRITAQLIAAHPERHLWANSYDREMRDVLTLTSDVAQAIAAEVRVVVTPAERQRLAAAKAVNPDAYQAYLKGQFWWNKRSEEGLKRALEYFKEAIRLEPDYAAAYAGVAASYILLPEYGALSPSEARAKVLPAVQKALELDDSLAQAHAVRGLQWGNDFQWQNAEDEFRRALALNPGYATTHQWHGRFLAVQGKFDEAEREFQTAQSLDPLAPILYSGAARVVYLASGRWDLALEQCRKALELEPTFADAHNTRGMVLARTGKYSEAILADELAVQYSGRAPYALAELAYTYAVVGRRDDAMRILRELQARAKQSYVLPTYEALVMVGLNERERALALLERSYNEGGLIIGRLPLAIDPSFVPLRDEPRFQALIRRMGVEYHVK